MKKILTLLASTGLVATTSATVVSCENVKSLTFAEGMDAAKLINASDVLKENIAEGKLIADFKDDEYKSNNSDIKIKGKVTGTEITTIANMETLYSMFNETKDLKNEVTSILDMTVYGMSVAGKKDATSFKLYVVKTTTKISEKGKGTITFKNVFSLKIDIPQS
ncbi:hypothetical protein SCHIN_v1c10010 [Spiroplasma chinense]|uniref:Lipoprotein n=1 Tax=Spiroplasma chinense TaxID=216932 RepID=A0A5B9Y519_9MOLU|nr:lipoprotein [Spiroplasma chinense]QEH62194.1 hypothetical protein SCHIN_v1c10010 [Spiroplasma chinense]